MDNSSGPFSVGEFNNDVLLRELLRSIGHVLGASGVSAESVVGHLDEFVDAVRTTALPVETVNLGSMQRECMELMCFWRRDSNFLSDQGLPRALSPYEGDRSFAALCRGARVPSPPQELLRVLIQFGAVYLDDDGNVVARTPTFILGTQLPTRVIAPDGYLRQLTGFVRVLEHNLLRVQEGYRPRFERTCSVRVATELVPVFERFLAERAQDFIDSIDEWLERQKSVISRSGETVEVGAGAYFLDVGTAL